MRDGNTLRKQTTLVRLTQPATALGIEFHEQVTILGITYGTTIAKSVRDSWAGVLRSVRAQARKAYARTLCLAQRIQYVHLCLLAKIGIWRKFSHPPRRTCNNSQPCAPGSFGRAQSSGYPWQPYNARKNKAAGSWRT